MKKKYNWKRVLKEIKKEKKKVFKDKKLTQIEQIAKIKNNTEDFYKKNISKIEDKDLLMLYRKVFKPVMLNELFLGLMSGILATFICEIYKGADDFKDNLILEAIVAFFSGILIAIAIIFVYRIVAENSSYNDSISEYHKDIIEKYIKEREEKAQKQLTSKEKCKSKSKRGDKK